MRPLRWLALCAIVGTGCARYDYEEVLHLELDGSGRIWMTGAQEIFTALHGAPDLLDPDAIAEAEIRRLFASPDLRVERVRSWRRGGRSFLSIRASFESLERLSRHPVFAARRFRLESREDALVLTAELEGVPHPRRSRSPREGRAAMRIRLPSPVRYHNSPRQLGRGNYVVWEQSLDDRLRGPPAHLEVGFERRSVLSVTVALLTRAVLLVGVAAAGALFWVVRIGRRQLAAEAVGPR